MIKILRLISVLASALVAIALPLAVAAMPRAAMPVLVISPPWHDEAAQMQIIANADARFLGRGRFDNTMLVAADRPDLVRRLYSAGALLVINGSLYPGCDP